MAKLIFEGLTLEQAECFAYWYEHSGPTEMASWARMDQLIMPEANKGGIKINGNIVTVYCKQEEV